MKSLFVTITFLFVSFFTFAQSDMQITCESFQKSTNFPLIDFKMTGYVVYGCQVIDTTGTDGQVRFLDIESGLTTIEDFTTLENNEYQVAIELFVDYMDNVTTNEDEDGNLWLQFITPSIDNCTFYICQLIEDGFNIVGEIPSAK